MGPECDPCDPPPYCVFQSLLFYASSHKPVEKNIGSFFFSEYYYTMLQVAGAIAAETSVLDTLVKECEEEASISADLACCAKPIGTIRCVVAKSLEY